MAVPHLHLTPGPDPELTELKRRVNLLELVPGLHRIASTRGGEYAGPCPFCGGADRFHAQPDPPEGHGGIWMCRQCGDGKWHDVITLVQQQQNCSFREAVAHLKGEPLRPFPIRPAAMRDERVTYPDRDPDQIYDYPAADGTLLFQVCRWDLTLAERPAYKDKTKLFRQRRPDGAGGWFWNVKGVARVLYNLPQICAADEAEPVFWVEGEKCADALIAAGLVATTNPGGTGAGWRPEYTDLLRGRRVILIPDADEAGRELGAKAHAALQGAASALKVVTLPSGVNDVADWFAAGASSDDLITLAKAAPVGNGDDPSTPTVSGPYRVYTRADVAALPPPTWLVTGMLETNTIAMLYGMWGIGKTFITLDLALAVATGRPWWGQSVKQGPVLYLLAEGTSGLHARLLAWEQARAQPAEHIYFIVDQIDLMDAKCVPDLLASVPAPPVLIVVDTLARSVGGGDQDSNTDMSKMVNTVSQLREQTGATVLLVHHPGKTDTGPRGASAISAACDTVLKLTGGGGMLKLQSEKQRNAPSENPWHFTLDVVEVGTRADNGEPLTSCAVRLSDSQAVPHLRTLTPAQRQILETLSSTILDPASAQELTDATTLSKSTIYRELDILEKWGLITEEKGGRGRRYQITPEGRDTLVAGVNPANSQAAWENGNIVIDLGNTPNYYSHSHLSINGNGNNNKTPPGTPENSGPVGIGPRPQHPCSDCGNVAWYAHEDGYWRCHVCGTRADLEVT